MKPNNKFCILYFQSKYRGGTVLANGRRDGDRLISFVRWTSLSSLCLAKGDGTLIFSTACYAPLWYRKRSFPPGIMMEYNEINGNAPCTIVISCFPDIFFSGIFPHSSPRTQLTSFAVGKDKSYQEDASQGLTSI